jgi:hypothetical protein
LIGDSWSPFAESKKKQPFMTEFAVACKASMNRRKNRGKKSFMTPKTARDRTWLKWEKENVAGLQREQSNVLCP